MSYVEPLWKKFETNALPKKMTTDQIEFSQISFYAGASSLFAVVMDKLDSAPSDRAGGQFLFEVEQELIRFMDQTVSAANSI
jgi:hypothetical protein